MVAIFLRSLTMERPIVSDPVRLLQSLTTQLERDRRAFLWGNAIYVAGNLILAGFVWIGPERGVLAWIAPAIAFLGNVYYALTTEWEMRWQGVWRRELPRLEHALGGIDIVSSVLADPGPRKVARGMKWLNWTITVAWLGALLLTLNRAGLIFRISG